MDDLVGAVLMGPAGTYYLVQAVTAAGRVTFLSLDDRLQYTEVLAVVEQHYKPQQWEYLVTYTTHEDDSVDTGEMSHVSADFGVRLAVTNAYGPDQAKDAVEAFSNTRGYGPVTPIKAEAVL